MLHKNKDENVHQFALSALRGELLERKIERERQRERATERERKRHKVWQKKAKKALGEKRYLR